jgi:hypothetical protein
LALSLSYKWHFDAKSGQKLTLFQGVTVYPLLPDYFISSTNAKSGQKPIVLQGVTAHLLLSD